MLHARLLRYLDEVARCQSMRQAGERLNVAGSAVNRQILALEEQLGVKLFERHPHKVVLTAAGEVLIDHVRQTLRDMDRTVGQIEALSGLQQGEVSIAVATGLAGTMIPVLIPRVRHVFSRIKLTIASLSTGAIVAAVLDGKADLGLGFDFPTKGLRVLRRRLDPLEAVMSVRHPLATRASITIEDCANFPLCVAAPTQSLRTRVNSAFEEAGIALVPAVETNSTELMRKMAGEVPFITFLSPFDAHNERRAGVLVHVPVLRMFAEPQTLMLVARKDDLSPLAGRVGEIFQTALDESW